METRIRNFRNADLHPGDKQIFREFAMDNYPGINTDWDEDEIEFVVLVDSGTKCIVGLLVMQIYNSNRVHIKLIVVGHNCRKRGLGTMMLRHVAGNNLDKKITLNIELNRLDLANFYCKYAKIEEVSFEHKVIVFLVNHVKLFADIPL